MSIVFMPIMRNIIRDRELREVQNKLTYQENVNRKREEKRKRLKISLGDIFTIPGKKHMGKEFIITNILASMFEYAEYIDGSYNPSSRMSMSFNDMNARVSLTGKNHFISNGGAMLDYTINEDIDLKVGDSFKIHTKRNNGRIFVVRNIMQNGFHYGEMVNGEIVGNSYMNFHDVHRLEKIGAVNIAK